MVSFERVPGILPRVRAVPCLLLALAGSLSPARASGEVAITEFLAANSGGLRDEDGESSDWIELRNDGDTPAGLEGWSLTDDPAEPRRWTFPAVTLGPGEALVVFASGKDRRVPGRELHANFRLDAEGEYLALVPAPGAGAPQEFSPAFPPQRANVAYGASLETVAALLSEGAAARFLVPGDGSAGLSWTGGGEPFADSPAEGWTEGPTGLGFDLAPPEDRPLVYFDFDDAGSPDLALDRSGRGNHGTLTSHLEFAGQGGAARPVYTAAGGGRTGGGEDRALDFGEHGDGGLVNVAGAAAGVLDSAVVRDAASISLWVHGSAAQPAPDSIFWGSSNPDGTGIRSLNAHVPWSDRIIYWDTGGCCDETQRVSKPEPDAGRWRGGWNHYLFVKDGDAKRIYQNGVLFLEGENTTDLTAIRGFFLGGAPRSGEFSYGGRLDDFAFWDRALSAGEAAALARGVSPLVLSSFAPLIRTDTAALMHGRNASVYARLAFDHAGGGDEAAADALHLRIRYQDGFIAYLNGVEVARRNAPPGAAFEAAAAAPRSRALAAAAEEIDLSARLGLLRPGRNVLAIHGLNDGAASPDFLLLPELRLARRTPDRYLVPPTPGGLNGPGFAGFVAPVRFSAERGFFAAPLAVELNCPTAGAAIFHTLDGSEPGPGRPGSRAYTGPIAIARTAMLRARAFKDGYEPADSVTHTYLFPSLAAQQPRSPPGLPATWSEGTPADYEMDPEVASRTLPGYGLEEALLSIPSVSIVMDHADLWDPSSGMYYHSAQTWEKPASIELLHPDGTRGFQANAGIRIHGYTSRYHYFTPKHSFRVNFKSRYGPPQLEHDLFPDSEVGEFDQFVLRGMSTDSWPVMDGWDGPEPGARRWYREQATYLREQWMKDSQKDLGNLAPHAFFVHVYLNGLYWGLYHLTERPTDSFQAAHLGGEREEYDVLKDFAEVQSGNGQAWRAMMDLASAGLAGAAAYQRIQGRNPDGTPDPSYPAYLDLDNLIDYMILHIYASADDWPNHNWWAGRRRGPASQGFKFFAWDQEISNTSLDYVHTSWGPRFEEAGAPDTPSYLYAQLRANPTFRLRFADRVHRHLFGDGALTARASGERLLRRAAEVDRAMVAESARWGDARRAAPFRRETEWLAEIARLHDEYWPALHPIALERFRRVGLYPAIAAPVFSRPGGRIEPGFALEIAVAEGAAWYTLDGSDPRLANGGRSPAALLVSSDPVVLGGTAVVKARAQVGGTWSALAEGFFFIDVPLRITEVMYHPADPPPESPHDDEDFEFIEVMNVGAASLSLAGARLSGAVRFDFAAGRLPELAPGAAAVVVRDLAAFASRYGTQLPVAGEYAGELGNAGERVVLEGPLGEPIHDFRYSDRWHPETDGQGPSLEIREASASPGAWGGAAGWRPSAAAGGSPGIHGGAPGGGRIPGDFTGDLVLNLSDPVALLRYLFLDGSAALPCPGALGEGGNLAVLDANGDGRADLADAIHVLSHLFLGGPAHHRGRRCAAIEGCEAACEVEAGG